MSFLPKYQLTAVPASAAAALGSGPIRVMKIVLFGGSAASQVELKNAATDTGTVLYGLNTPTADSRKDDFSNVGGIAFPVGCFVKPAGTGAIAYVWWEPMQTQVATV